MYLIDIVKRFRKGVFIALSLVVIEHVAWIAEPSIFGVVIDALIDAASGTKAVSYAFPLAVWIGVFAINSGVGAWRRSLDQKIFLKIFTEIAVDVSKTSQIHGLSVSKTAARAELSREYITFFQYRVPEIIEQVIALGGALIGMAVFDWRISAACSIVVVPLVFANNIYNKKVIELQKTFHDKIEDTYEVFSKQDPEKVREYYTNLAQPQQRIADWGGTMFGVMRLFLLVIFLVVLYIAIDLDDFTTGSIYSIVAYLWTFVTTSEYLPELMESWTSLKDISQRLRAQEI